jgi:hypothetical protein
MAPLPKRTIRNGPTKSRAIDLFDKMLTIAGSSTTLYHSTSIMLITVKWDNALVRVWPRERLTKDI